MARGKKSLATTDLGHRIQDEIIYVMANEIKQKIIKNIQSVKYFRS
jgi:hypothetical protein